MFDLDRYQSIHPCALVRPVFQKPGAEILLLRDDAHAFILRAYDHPVPAYETMKDVSLPALPRIYRYTQTSTGEVLVEEEFIDGVPLSAILETSHLHWRQATAIARQVCYALQALHSRGLIHRDVKPDNILVTSQGRVVLLDLDAVSSSTSEKDRDTQLLGTVGYAAPEQFGFGRSDARTDIFAVGVLLNVMLTGTHPANVLADGPLRPVIQTAIRTNADQRFPSVEALLKRLPPDSPAVPCPVCGFVSPGGGCIHCGTPPMQRWKPWLLAAAAAVLMVLGAVCLIPHAAPEPPPVEVPPMQERAAMPEVPTPAVPEEMPEMPIHPAPVYNGDLFAESDFPLEYHDKEEVYFLAPALWESGTGQPISDRTMQMEDDQVREMTFGIAFWTLSQDNNWLLCDQKTTEALTASLPGLELEFYAAQEGQVLPEAIPADPSCTFACPMGLRYNRENDGMWYFSLRLPMKNQVFRSTISLDWSVIHPVVFTPDLHLDTAPLRQINDWLQDQLPLPGTVYSVELPSGTFAGQIEVPDYLGCVYIKGASDGGTILQGGIHTAGDCYMAGITFQGCGKDRETWPDGTPNSAFYGGGYGAFDSCTLMDYACAVPVTKNLCFGSYGTTFMQNGTVFLYDSQELLGGNMEMTACLFLKNDVAMEFRSINDSFSLSNLLMHDTVFRNNGVDLVSHISKEIWFPGNTFLHNSVPGPITVTTGAPIHLD